MAAKGEFWKNYSAKISSSDVSFSIKSIYFSTRTWIYYYLFEANFISGALEFPWLKLILISYQVLGKNLNVIIWVFQVFNLLPFKITMRLIYMLSLTFVDWQVWVKLLPWCRQGLNPCKEGKYPMLAHEWRGGFFFWAHPGWNHRTSQAAHMKGTERERKISLPMKQGHPEENSIKTAVKMAIYSGF